MRTLFLVALAILSFSDTHAQNEDEYPPHLPSNKCYAKPIIFDEYRIITEEVLVKEGYISEEGIVYSPVYDTISKNILTKRQCFTEWIEVVCEKNLTPELLQKIIEALEKEDYDCTTGLEDKELKIRARISLLSFQKDNHLPMGRFDVKTLEVLGISISN